VTVARDQTRRDAITFALLRALPLGDRPRGPSWLYRRWLALLDTRYNLAEKAWGRERARVYDYIPF
jgi:hypothetical protein